MNVGLGAYGLTGHALRCVFFCSGIEIPSRKKLNKTTSYDIEEDFVSR